MAGPASKGYATTSIRLPQADLDWARRRAEELDVSVSWVIRNALKAERQAVEMQAE